MAVLGRCDASFFFFFFFLECIYPGDLFMLFLVTDVNSLLMGRDHGEVCCVVLCCGLGIQGQIHTVVKTASSLRTALARVGGKDC